MKKPRAKKVASHSNSLVPFFALGLLAAIIYALHSTLVPPSGAATNTSGPVVPGPYPVPLYQEGEEPAAYQARLSDFLQKNPQGGPPIPYAWEDADLRRPGTPIEEFTARVDAIATRTENRDKWWVTMAEYEAQQKAYNTATGNLPWLEYQQTYMCKVSIVSWDPAKWGIPKNPTSSHPGKVYYYDSYGCSPGDTEIYHIAGSIPEKTSTPPTNTSTGGTTGGLGRGDVPGPEIQLPFGANDVLAQDPPKTTNLLCYVFKNLSACKSIFEINEHRQAYIDYLYTKGKNGSAYYKVAYGIMSKVLGIKGTYFENEEGPRVRIAADAIKTFIASKRGNPWVEPRVKDAKEKGIIKPNKRGYPEYVPYQDSRYPKLYYYRCGPFDLVGTLDNIKKECTQSAEIRRDSDGLDTFSYPFDPAKALLVDMQAVNRTKFDNGIPPYIVKYGSYVYGDDDARMSVLTYPWFIGKNHYEKEQQEIDGKMQEITVRKEVTYNDPLRDLPETPGGTDGFEGYYYDYLGGPDFSNVLITSKYYTGDRITDRPYINRYNEVLTSNDREVTPNTLSLEWIRAGANQVRKVFTVKVTEEIAANPPTLYARDGDVIRYYIPKGMVAEIISQPLKEAAGTLEDRQVPKLDTWGITFAPIAARLDSTNSGMVPIYQVGGVTIQNYGRVYEYQVGFGDDPNLLSYPIHRVRYRIQASGNTGSLFLSNPDLFNNKGTYGYILQEVSYKKDIYCPRTHIPTNNNFSVTKKVCLPRL